MELAGSLVLLVGAVVTVLAAWGVVDFPTPIARMHAATKPASLGLALLTIGAGITASSWDLIGVGLLVTVFLFLTAPISGHLLGRAAYLAGQAGRLEVDDLAGAEPGAFAPTEPRRGPSPLRVIAFAVIWVALWRDLSVGNVINGILVGLFVGLVSRERTRGARISPVGAAVFVVRYAGLVVASTARVAWEVITPTNERVREAIIEVPLRVSSAPAVLLLANAISYTPGTLTLEVCGGPAPSPARLWVHVLQFESVSQVVDEVRRIEDLVMAALPERAEA
jgi:multicomponent Na+:H+ antiporter subunit G